MESRLVMEPISQKSFQESELKKGLKQIPFLQFVKVMLEPTMQFAIGKNYIVSPID